MAEPYQDIYARVTCKCISINSVHHLTGIAGTIKVKKHQKSRTSKAYKLMSVRPLSYKHVIHNFAVDRRRKDRIHLSSVIGKMSEMLLVGNSKILGCCVSVVLRRNSKVTLLKA